MGKHLCASEEIDLLSNRHTQGTAVFVARKVPALQQSPNPKWIFCVKESGRSHWLPEPRDIGDHGHGSSKKLGFRPWQTALHASNERKRASARKCGH